MYRKRQVYPVTASALKKKNPVKASKWFGLRVTLLAIKLLLSSRKNRDKTKIE